MPHPCHIGAQHPLKKAVTFSFLVPVCVVVEDDVVAKVVILDEDRCREPEICRWGRGLRERGGQGLTQRPGLAGLGVRLVAPTACRPPEHEAVRLKHRRQSDATFRCFDGARPP